MSQAPSLLRTCLQPNFVGRVVSLSVYLTLSFTVAFTVALTLLLPHQASAVEASAVEKPELGEKPSRVLVVGDSMSGCYAGPLRTIVKDQFSVFLIKGNGRTTEFSLTKIDEWMRVYQPQIALLNWGIHDSFHRYQQDPETGEYGYSPVLTDEAYLKNLEELIRRVRAEGTFAIWVPITPLLEIKEKSDPATVAHRNQIAIDLMKRLDVPVFDTREVLDAAHPMIVHEDRLHFTKPGCQLYGALIAAHLQKFFKD